MSPRSKQQFLALREMSRERIVEAATDLFAGQGFHGTSISAIAQAAKVSNGLMYNYFESRGRLLDAILEKAFMEINRPMVMLLEEKDPFDRLNANVEATFSIVKNKEDRLHWQFMISIITQHDVVKRMLSLSANYRRRSMTTFESIFKEMGEANPKMESYRLAAILDGAMLHCLSVFGKSYPLEEMKNEILNQYEMYRTA